MQAASEGTITTNDGRSERIGFMQGIGCHLVWGIMPIYWKLLSAIPALEVLSWRSSCCCARS